MSDRFELAKSWFNTANEDILAAEHEMRYEDAILRSVCFHCQQAVEARYPDPDTIITLDRAKEALAIAYEVRNRILEKIN